MFSSGIEFSQFSGSFKGALLWSSISLGLFLLVQRLTATPRSRLPPGPKGIPFFGNTFQLKFGAEPWRTCTKWKATYGPMVYLNMAGLHVLVLNDPVVAADLLDRRAGIYSDRPRNIVAGEIMTGGFHLPITRYGDLWRRLRRAAHEALKMSTAPKYHPIQQNEAVILASDLIKDPEHWNDHLRRATASAVASMIYDMPPLKSMSDPSIATASDLVERTARAATPGAHLVEFLPILNYVPRAFAKWKRESEYWFSAYSKTFQARYTEIETRVLSGEEQRPSFCATLAETSTRHNLTNLQSSWLAATMFVAGADTSSTTLAWFVVAVTAFPDAQRKAQAELDEVVGRARPPSFSDWDHLPYVRALAKEVLRWRPPVPLAVPHSPIQDDWYKGYLIPKGTICFPNVWAMNQDPNIFGPDAADFNPSRHLDEQGKLKPSPDTKDDGHFSFGFGRRFCVGRNVANYSTFIHIAIVLWALTFQPGTDADGKSVRPDVNATIDDGLLARPFPFQCTITPRFPDVESLLAQAKEEGLEKRGKSLRNVKPITIEHSG